MDRSVILFATLMAALFRASKPMVSRIRGALAVAVAWVWLGPLLIWVNIALPGLWLGWSESDWNMALGMLMAFSIPAPLRFLYACIFPPRDPSGERRAALTVIIPLFVLMLVTMDAGSYSRYLWPPAATFPCQ